MRTIKPGFMFSSLCAALFLFAGSTFAQVQPAKKAAAPKTASLTTARCAHKSGSCCKGTPTRVAVLATTVASMNKEVKKN